MKRNLDSVQALRGIAAVAVALHHGSDQIETFATYKDGSKVFWLERFLNSDAGAIGVDIFFLISGFIMAYTVYQKPLTAPQFLKRRFIRIYPLYWFFSLVVIALHFTPWIGRHHPTVEETVKAFLLYPHFFSYDGMTLIRPYFIGQGWTLIYEILFYLLFALFIRWSQLRRIAVITGIFLGLRLLALRFFPNSPEGVLLVDPIIFEFCAGLLIGWAFTLGKIQLPRWGLFLGLALSVLLLIPPLFVEGYMEVPRLIRFGIPAFFLVGSLVLSPIAETWRYPRFLKLLGDASYSIYLTHTIVLLLFITGYIRLPFMQALSLDVYFWTLAVSMIAAGLVAYFLVEKPLLHFCRKFV